MNAVEQQSYPLKGVRVLDFGIITAGAATGAVLADLGAQVIKIESPGYKDPFRLWAGDRPAGAQWTHSPLFRATNRNKLNLCLDLRLASGRDVLMKLAQKSDVVVENFRRGVLDKLGINYSALKAANPDIILASISSQGDSGSEAGQVSYGSTLEGVGGLAWRTGYRGGAPVVSGVDLNYPDQVAAIFAAGMVVTALRKTRETGGGAHLDLSQRELTTFLSGDIFAGGLSPSRDAARTGNDEADYLFQDCLKAADGTWIAVSVQAGDIEGIGRLTGDQPPGTSAEWCRSRLATWIAARGAPECVHGLIGVGIATSIAGGGAELLARRPWTSAIFEIADGTLFKGLPFRFDGLPPIFSGDAQPPGADTVEVLRDIGGLSDLEIASLAAEGAVEIYDHAAVNEDA